MSRSVSWRMAVSDSCNWHQTQALDSTIYILRQTGPTGFLLQEEGETKNVKVFLGNPHTCTCSVFKKEKDLCKHICWLLLRKFRLSVNDPLSWQLALVEREINEILQGHVTSDQKRGRQHQKNAKVIESADGRNIVQQRDIADDDVCPICQEELLSKKLLVTYCKFGCGNSIHIKCMNVWAEHQLKTAEDGKIKCPMCREDFGPLDLLKTEMKNAGYIAPPAPGLRMDRHVGVTCSHCGVAPIVGKCYRCTVCPAFFMCQKCFNLPIHTSHSMQFRQKQNQRWHPATRTIGNGLHPNLANDLMQREISESDYDLLLQLDRNSQEELSNLSEEALQSIPVERVREGGSLLALGCQCRVCLRGFVVGQYVRKLPCKHKFHKDCIDSWLLHSHPTCPIDGLLAVSSQPTLPTIKKNVLHPRGLNNDQPQSCHPHSEGLALTAFGIPIASSRLTSATAGGEVNLQNCSNQRSRQNPSSAIRLELSGLPFGSGKTSMRNQQVEMTEEIIPQQQFLQQAIEHRNRISQQMRKVQRTISSGPNSCELLTHAALIQHLQSESQSRPTTTEWENSVIFNIPRVATSSASSMSGAARLPAHCIKPGNRNKQRAHSILHGRSNSIERCVPSIQNVREVVGDLFLGNNPTIHPAVSENWNVSKPPKGLRSRTRAFRSIFHNHLSSLHRLADKRNADMRLEGSALEYNVNDDQPFNED